MMKQHFTYLSYNGTDDYAYLGCFSAQEPLAAQVLALLACRGMRFSYAVTGGRETPDSEALAERIANCRAAILFLSPESLESLSFRNTVNYLLSLRKPLFCIKTADFPLSHGLEMQLANIPVTVFSTPEDTAEQLLQSGILTQDIVGPCMLQKTDTHRKKRISAVMIAAFLVAFLACAAAAVAKKTSPATLLRDADGSSYLSISAYGDKGIDALADKSVQELDLSDGHFSSIDGIEKINIETVNVAGLPDKISLRPLLSVNGLQTVKIDQTQLIYARELYNAGLRVEIVR